MAVCELYANNAVTNLAANISSFDVTITVVNPTPFPASAPFRILIDDEICLVTAGPPGATWTITRGEENTVPVSHFSGAEVRQILTKAGLLNFMECNIDFGDISTLPSPGTKGRLFFTDDPGWYIFQDQGSEWSEWTGFHKLYEPNETGFSWINQGAATTTTAAGGVQLRTPPPGVAGDNVRIRVESAPATPYVVTAAFIPTLSPINQTSAGLIFRQNTGGGAGRFIFFRFMFDTTSAVAKSDTVISLDKYTNPTTFNSNYFITTAAIIKSTMVWLRMEDDGTDLFWSYSNDGFNFEQLFTVSRTDFLTTGPEQIGYAVNSNNTSAYANMTLLSYRKT